VHTFHVMVEEIARNASATCYFKFGVYLLFPFLFSFLLSPTYPSSFHYHSTTPPPHYHTTTPHHHTTPPQNLSSAQSLLAVPLWKENENITKIISICGFTKQSYISKIYSTNKTNFRHAPFQLSIFCLLYISLSSVGDIRI
jgi:hypothetical protein